MSTDVTIQPATRSRAIRKPRPRERGFTKHVTSHITSRVTRQVTRQVIGLITCLLAAQALGGAHLQRAYAQDDDSSDATRAAARRLGAQGIEAYWANDFSTADDKLDRAFRLYATATLGLWSGRARAQLGRLVEAAERFREATRAAVVGDAKAQKKAQSEARQELDQLVPRIPTLTIHLANARVEDVEVTLDGALIPGPLLDEARPTDPGSHHIVAVRGTERREADVQLSEGEQKRINLQFLARNSAASEPVAGNGTSLALTPMQTEANQTVRPASADTRQSEQAANTSPLKPIGIITLAFGTAGLATAGITALIANSKRSQCSDNVCPPDIKTTYDELRTVSTVAFYAGAGLALGGLVMWLAAPREDTQPTPALSWTLGPGGVAVSGKF